MTQEILSDSGDGAGPTNFFADRKRNGECEFYGRLALAAYRNRPHLARRVPYPEAVNKLKRYTRKQHHISEDLPPHRWLEIKQASKHPARKARIQYEFNLNYARAEFEVDRRP